MLKAERILLICWLLFPIVVNANREKDNANTIEKGIIILIDLDKNKNEPNPIPIHAIPVRVPDGNMPQRHARPVNMKKLRRRFILLVIPKIINATSL